MLAWRCRLGSDAYALHCLALEGLPHKNRHPNQNQHTIHFLKAPIKTQFNISCQSEINIQISTDINIKINSKLKLHMKFKTKTDAQATIKIHTQTKIKMKVKINYL